MKIILGSGSKYKKEELEKAGFEFEVFAVPIDEKAVRHDDVYKTPELVAHAKMDALIAEIKEEAYVITADAAAVCAGRLIEKPTSREELHEWAELYEKFPTNIVSGVVVCNTKNGKKASATDISLVKWGPIDCAKLDEIIEQGDIWNCAGFNQEMVNAFAVEHDPFDRLRGMPIDLVKKLLDEVQ